MVTLNVFCQEKGANIEPMTAIKTNVAVNSKNNLGNDDFVVPYLKLNRKYILVNSDLKPITEKEYEGIGNIECDCFLCNRGFYLWINDVTIYEDKGKYGLINKKGIELTDAIYENLYLSEDKKYFAFEKYKKDSDRNDKGYIDFSGNVLNNIIYEKREAQKKLKNNNQSLFFVTNEFEEDNEDIMLISNIDYYRNKDAKFRLINNYGKYLGDFKFKYSDKIKRKDGDCFSNYHPRISKSDLKGNFIIDLGENNKLLLDKNGNVISTNYDYITQLKYPISDNEYYAFRKGSYEGFLDYNGKEIYKTLSYSFANLVGDYCYYFSFCNLDDNLIAAFNKITLKYGFVNTKGKTNIPFNYDFVGGFNEGVCIAKKNNHFICINTKGEKLFSFSEEVNKQLDDYFLSSDRNKDARLDFIHFQNNLFFSGLYSYHKGFYIDTNGREYREVKK